MFFLGNRHHENKSRSDIKIIVGLGNPGMEYAKNRHNFGLMILDALADRWQVRFRPAKGSFIFADPRKSCDFPAPTCSSLRLCKPMTYMNDSGIAAKQILKYFKAEPSNMLVIYDDIDLLLGKMRVRKNGSSGGHRGMQSIIDQLGTEEFPRLRLGIGLQDRGVPAEDFVLMNFRKEEWHNVQDMIDIGIQAILEFADKDINWIMNKYNPIHIA